MSSNSFEPSTESAANGVATRSRRGGSVPAQPAYGSLAKVIDEVTVLIVPGLRDHVPQHWQTLLAAQLTHVRCVPPMGRENLDLDLRIEALELAARAIDGPIVLVAHSGGVITVAHWADRTGLRVQGALLAAPPDFERPMPAGYPSIDALRAGGWLPVPRSPLPFPSIAALSRNDPLGEFHRTDELARAWGSSVLDLGEVGHLNPASGYGEWPRARSLIAELAAIPSYCWLKSRIKK